MSALTSRFRFSLPPREGGAALAAGLAVVLALAALVQLLLGVESRLPAAAPGVVRPARTPAPPVLPVTVPVVIVERDIFTPPPAGPAGAPSPGAKLGGATIAGSVSVRGRRTAVVVLPGGTIRNMAPGETLVGWTLTGLAADRAIFRRGEERLSVPFGAPVAPPAEETEDSESQ